MTQPNWLALSERIYRALLAFYPAEYRQEYGPSMVQVFRDVSRAAYRKRGRAGLAWWWVVTLADLVRTAIEQNAEKRPVLMAPSGQQGTLEMTTQRWGALASFTLAVLFIIPMPLYLLGPVEPALLSVHDLADFLFGPLWAASLIMAVFALRERIGERAPRRMSGALVAAALTAAMFVAAAVFRSTNRHTLAWRVELTARDPTLTHTLFVPWLSAVQVLVSTGWHFLGWTLLLLGVVSLTTRQLPRALGVLYLVAGIVSLFVYAQPELEGQAMMLGLVWGIWQGIVLWRAERGEKQALSVHHEPA